MWYNGVGYDYLRGLAQNRASTYQIETTRGFSEVGENKQLLIASVVLSLSIETIIIQFLFLQDLVVC